MILKLFYLSPQICWSDCQTKDMLCYSTDIDSFEYEEIDWTDNA